MWSWRCDWLDADTLRFRPEREGERIRWKDVLALWRDSAEFRSAFNATLADVSFAAFRWETPAVTDRDLGRAFEFVAVNSPALDTAPDPAPFAEYFPDSSEETVVTFSNLGGDARLVAPCPAGPGSAYTHLAAFVQNAPESQQHELWQAVGREMAQRVGPVPVWLSTAGGGVAWLHVRLDDQPKYYSHGPYRSVRT